MKQKSSQQQRVYVPYVTIITHYAKSLGFLSPRYEMIHFAVKYNLDPITKMGYRDQNNNGKFVKVRGVMDEDDDEKENTLAAQDLTTPILTNIMGVLTLMKEDFESFRGEVRS